MGMREISELRKQIDILDDKIVDLFNERAKLALEIKKLKLANNMPILDKAREEKIHQMIKQRNEGLLKEEDLERIYALLLEVMRGIDAS